MASLLSLSSVKVLQLSNLLSTNLPPFGSEVWQIALESQAPSLRFRWFLTSYGTICSEEGARTRTANVNGFLMRMLHVLFYGGSRFHPLFLPP